MASENYNYEEIYEAYYSRIVKYLSRTIGHDEARDMAQDVFVKVFDSIGRFRGESAVYTWIYRIATNHLIDMMRKKKREHPVDRCNLLDKKLFCKGNPEYLTEEFRIVEKEMHECICYYIKMLPANYHTIIILREYESMPLQEIARVMDITPGNAKKMLTRARLKLKKLLIERCDFYYNELNRFSCEKK